MGKKSKSSSTPNSSALAGQTLKMLFRKKHVKRSIELIGAVAIVYLMLEILEAGSPADVSSKSVSIIHRLHIQKEIIQLMTLNNCF